MAKIAIVGSPLSLKDFLTLIYTRIANPKIFSDYGVSITTEGFEVGEIKSLYTNYVSEKEKHGST